MKHLKRFIIISFSIVLAVPMWGCAWPDTHNYYLFSVCQPEEFSQRVHHITMDNWKAYLGTTQEYYWFDADEVAQAAQKKGDALMVSYVRQLARYLDCAQQVRQEQWEYPTKAQKSQRLQTLLSVRTYASGKLKTRLRSQHALLFMRCNMMLGRHTENITFWEQTASKYIETVYKDMMQNIYAGALLKTGQADRAGMLFAQMGDWQSLMTQYYKKRSFAAIRQEYLRDPNSAVLPFLLQDFVNNAQEAVDAQQEWYPEGKLFIRNIQRSEAQQMQQLAAQVVREGKSRQPAMWMSAKAWLEYLFGKKTQALSDANSAVSLEGSGRVKDNAHVIQLYITAALSTVNQAFDDRLAHELTWLDSKKDDRHYVQVLDRLTYQVLGDKYSQAGRLTTMVALLKATQDNRFETVVDTMRIDSLLHYLDYAASPAQSALDNYLKPRQQLDQAVMNDLVGTKYLRLCNWEEALRWLTRVPLSFYNQKGYAVYASNRRYTVEPWVKRQWLKGDLEYNHPAISLKSNPKVDFAREVQRMEGELKVLSGKARQQQCYDLAIRYAQAHFTGDCWFLMRDGKSVSDTLRVHESDLAAKAVSLLRQASQATDITLKERALFALSYGALYKTPWHEQVWSDQLTDYQMVVYPKSRHYQALSELAGFEQSKGSPVSRYVSRCDDYIQFKKQYRP